MNMMELKSMLISRIAEINDIEFLKDIKALLDKKAEEMTIDLTSDQKAEVHESQDQIKEGLFLYNKDLDNEIQEWLKDKSYTLGLSSE